MNSTEDKIGLIPLTALVTGNLVGSGVFLLPVILAIYGTTSIIAWMMASAGAVLLSLVFAQMSAQRPKTGGPYVYVREAFGDAAGYYVCWGYWLLAWISNPALSIAAVGYISSLCGGLDPWTNFSLEVLIVILLTLINLSGLRFAGQFELVITIMKVIPLIGLPLIAFFFIDINNVLNHINVSGQSFMGSLNAATLIAMWSFSGLESGTVPAGQVENARRIVPLATIIGTLLAALIYILGTIVIMAALSPESLLSSKAPYADMAHEVFGGTWGIPISITAILGCMGTLNGWIMIVGRIPYGAAQDGLFPKIFLNTTNHGTPHYGILISTACSLPLLALSLQKSLMEQFEVIISVAVTLILLIYAISVLSYIQINRKSGTFRGWNRLLGILSMGFSIWTLWAANIKMILASLIVLLLGVPMRLWMTKKTTEKRIEENSPTHLPESCALPIRQHK